MPPNDQSRSDVDEPVEVVAYDPAWLEAFGREQVTLLSLLRPDVIAVEHFGSTAVPDLAAKPVVDVLIGLRRYPPLERVLATLSRSGYVCLGEAGVPGRHYCRKRPASGLAFNAALALHDAPLWKNNLAVRDYLRAHPAEAERYSKRKREAAEATGSLLAYSDRKAVVVASLLERARAWAGLPSGRGIARGCC